MSYNKKAKAASLQVGDKVLVKILAFSGPHKLSGKYEQPIYEVVERPNDDIPVYVVKDPDGRKKSCTGIICYL
jgi:hypothetical protein